MGTHGELILNRVIDGKTYKIIRTIGNVILFLMDGMVFARDENIEEQDLGNPDYLLDFYLGNVK